MVREPLTADVPVATSQELLHGALRRSSRRGARVARRRLWWRWTLWAAGRALVWAGPPLLLALAVAWWLWGWPGDSAPQAPAAASRSIDPPSGTASDAMPAASAPANPPTLQLRLDDTQAWQDTPPPPPAPRHQLPSSRAGKPAAPDSLQESP